jgi:hypothetical protein
MSGGFPVDVSGGFSTTDSELLRQETASQGANASVCLENFPPGQIKEISKKGISTRLFHIAVKAHLARLPIGSMYGIYANIGGILMVNVTIYTIHGSYGLLKMTI